MAIKPAKPKSPGWAVKAQKPDVMAPAKRGMTKMQQDKVNELAMHIRMLEVHKSAVLGARDQQSFERARAEFDRLYHAIAGELRQVGLPASVDMQNLWQVTRTRGGQAEAMDGGSGGPIDWSQLDGLASVIRNAHQKRDVASMNYHCPQYQRRFQSLLRANGKGTVFTPQPYVDTFNFCMAQKHLQPKAPPSPAKKPDYRIADPPPPPTPRPNPLKPGTPPNPKKQREWEAFGGASAGEVELEISLDQLARFTGDGELMSAQSSPVTDAEWRGLAQAHQLVNASAGAAPSRLAALKGVFVSRYQTVMAKLSERREPMPEQYRTAFRTWYPQFQAQRLGGTMEKRGPQMNKKRLNEAELELEQLLERFG